MYISVIGRRMTWPQSFNTTMTVSLPSRLITTPRCQVFPSYPRRIHLAVHGRGCESAPALFVLYGVRDLRVVLQDLPGRGRVGPIRGWVSLLWWLLRAKTRGLDPWCWSSWYPFSTDNEDFFCLRVLEWMGAWRGMKKFFLKRHGVACDLSN